MALYFFEYTDDGDARPGADQLGTDFPIMESVAAEAVGVLAAIVKDRLPDGSSRVFGANVRDDQGRMIYSATLTLEAGWK